MSALGGSFEFAPPDGVFVDTALEFSLQDSRQEDEGQQALAEDLMARLHRRLEGGAPG